MMTSLFSVFLGVDAASLPVGDLETSQALEAFMQSLGGLKGATALGISFAVVQAIMLFFRTPLAAFAGKWRLVIVTGLSLVVGTLGLALSGLPVGAALLHSQTFAALQVFINQIFKQFQKAE